MSYKIVITKDDREWFMRENGKDVEYCVWKEAQQFLGSMQDLMRYYFGFEMYVKEIKNDS